VTWFIHSQASELNAVVSEVFNTAFLYKSCRPGLSHVTTAPSGIQQPAIVQSPQSSRPTRERVEKTSDVRLSATVVCQSPSDGSISDVDCPINVPPPTFGGGMGSISSITESVNSWSFKIPASPSSDELAASEESVGCEPLLTETLWWRREDANDVSLQV